MRLVTDTSGCSEEILKAHAKSLRGYASILESARLDQSYETPESVLHAPFDPEAIEQALAIAHEFGQQLKMVILVGIGGSDLGTRALYDARAGEQRLGNSDDAHPELVCFDTIEPLTLNACGALFERYESPESYALVVISKSGTTIETVVNANALFTAFTKRFGTDAATRRTLYIGDDSDRLRAVRERGVRCVPMPRSVGGRFSVFSPVGLVPLALLGFDIRQLCEGAGQAIQASLPPEGYGPASVIASILFENYTTGRTVHELYFFHPRLKTLGQWYRQLLAESLGKERRDGTRVGIMPSICIGSTDLHSMGQLAFGGPVNRVTTFVGAPSLWQHNASGSIDSDSPFTLPLLAGKTSTDAMRAIYEGVQRAYRAEKLPYMVTELATLSEREIGAWMGLHMAMVLYAAQLFDVNAFDQPAVERYKKETRSLLEASS